jgi:hypothetical protein
MLTCGHEVYLVQFVHHWQMSADRGDKENNRIKECLSLSSRNTKGEVWLPIDSRWFKAWKEYTLFEAKDPDAAARGLRPGRIDNSDLLDPEDPIKLKQGLKEGLDFDLVPYSIWRKLKQWYGGGPAFPRYVIETGIPGQVRSFKTNCFSFRLVEISTFSGVGV